MTNREELAKRLEGCANFLKSIGNIYTAAPIYAQHTEAAARELRSIAAGESELLGVLTDVCQLIDGWHADVAWSEWDETVRWRVHCVMAKLDGREPLPRESFRRARAKVPEGLGEELNRIAPAVEALARHQMQADEEGTFVTVSRQAVDEVCAAINSLALMLAAAPTPEEKT